MGKMMMEVEKSLFFPEKKFDLDLELCKKRGFLGNGKLDQF